MSQLVLLSIHAFRLSGGGAFPTLGNEKGEISKEIDAILKDKA
jgi:hypothetical protein